MRLGDADEARVVTIEIFGDENRTGVRGGELGDVKQIPEEAQLILGRIGQRRDASNDTIVGAAIAAADEGDDFFDGNCRHRAGIVTDYCFLAAGCAAGGVVFSAACVASLKRLMTESVMSIASDA